MNWLVDPFKKSLNLIYGVFTKDQTLLTQQIEKETVNVVGDLYDVVCHGQSTKKLKKDEIELVKTIVQLILEEAIKMQSRN